MFLRERVSSVFMYSHARSLKRYVKLRVDFNVELRGVVRIKKLQQSKKITWQSAMYIEYLWTI